jgi:hypothetical protein
MTRHVARLMTAAITTGVTLFAGTVPVVAVEAPRMNDIPAGVAPPTVLHGPPAGSGTLSASAMKRLGMPRIDPLDSCERRVLAAVNPGTARLMFVSVEWDATGDKWAMLRARAIKIDIWEWLTVCRDFQTGAYYMLAPYQGNGANDWYFVTADFNLGGKFNGQLRARTLARDYPHFPGTWELFFKGCPWGGFFCLQSWKNDTERPYVAVEWADTGDEEARLNARSATAGVWESRFALCTETCVGN